MDEELLKRNTDCVYFLASPFTCKKGTECEYRHSEIARLNPRDCWYWLSGKCLNPICGFRHPPVDMHAKAQAEAEPVLNKSSFPPSKNKVSCYFYLNGLCSKGDKCTFLHVPEDKLASKQKDFAVVDAPSVDDRMPPNCSNPIVPAEVPNDKLPTKISKAKRPSRIEPVLDQLGKFPAVPRSLKTAQEDQLPRKKLADIFSNLERKDSSHSLLYEYEDASVTWSDDSDSLNSSDYIIKSDPSMCSDQCSKEKADYGVQGEGWESSPGSGFDVLVERRSEGIEDAYDEEDKLGYEDCYDRNDEDHENLFKDHSYKDQKGCVGRFLREKRIHGPVCYSDDEDIFDLVGYSDKDRGVNHILSQKRKFINVGLAVGGHDDVDLRDHLAKRRSLNGRLEMPAERFAFRRCNLPLQSKDRRERPQSRISSQMLHGRFALRLERNNLCLPLEKSTFAVKQRHQAWNSQPNSCMHHHNQKRQMLSSNVQRTKLSRRERDNSFTGPKTLAQIRETKCRTRVDSKAHSSHSSSVNFVGPKPLTEILQDKKKVRSAGEFNNVG